MKCTLIGREVVSYKSKTDGQDRTMLILHVTRTTPRCRGIATDQVRIFSGQECYDKAVNLDIDSAISIDYNQRGLVEDVDML